MRSLALRWCLEAVKILYFPLLLFFLPMLEYRLILLTRFKYHSAARQIVAFFLIPLFILSSLFCIRPRGGNIPPSLCLCSFIHAFQCGLWGFHSSIGYNPSPTLGAGKRSRNAPFILSPLQARGRVQSSPSMCKV